LASDDLNAAGTEVSSWVWRSVTIGGAGLVERIGRGAILGVGGLPKKVTLDLPESIGLDLLFRPQEKAAQDLLEEAWNLHHSDPRWQ
jgi:hypothetical protein